jgi:hypothetical protein
LSTSPNALELRGRQPLEQLDQPGEAAEEIRIVQRVGDHCAQIAAGDGRLVRAGRRNRLLDGGRTPADARVPTQAEAEGGEREKADCQAESIH